MTDRGMWRWMWGAIALMAALGALTPAARAAITPTVTLDQSAGTAAGSTTNLGVDIKFAPTGSDSPQDVTLSLPAGLLANASIDHGACLTSATVPNFACQVGTGTVTAAPNVIPIPIPQHVSFDLVAPPAGSGDLAGLAVVLRGKQLGGTAGIAVRPASDPAGLGLNITFTDLPQTFFGLGIHITEIKSTFVGLRYPTSCPATPANLTVSASSYADPTSQTTSAPLTVTGCSSLPFVPLFTVSAVRDSADQQAQVTTDITQGVGQAASRSVALAFPSAVLSPNLGVLSALCANPSSGTCTAIGSTSATSPLFPAPLTGLAYFTGSLAAPSITLVFPPPFALDLVGAVSLASNSTTFTAIPDLPLSELQVTLNGGATGAYQATCAMPAGTATATLTSQNGDETARVPASFAVSHCPPTPAPGSTPTGHGRTVKAGKPKLSRGSLRGLVNGKPSLSFTLAAGSHAPKLTAFTIELPKSLSVISRKVHGHRQVPGLSLSGATVKSISVSSGHLLVQLRTAVTHLTAKISAKGLSETAGLRSEAHHHKVQSLKLTVIARDAKGKRTTVTLSIRKLGVKGG